MNKMDVVTKQRKKGIQKILRCFLMNGGILKDYIDSTGIYFSAFMFHALHEES